jgi:hypothetical protein
MADKDKTTIKRALYVYLPTLEAVEDYIRRGEGKEGYLSRLLDNPDCELSRYGAVPFIAEGFEYVGKAIMLDPMRRRTACVDQICSNSDKLLEPEVKTSFFDVVIFTSPSTVRGFKTFLDKQMSTLDEKLTITYETDRHCFTSRDTQIFAAIHKPSGEVLFM